MIRAPSVMIEERRFDTTFQPAPSPSMNGVTPSGQKRRRSRSAESEVVRLSSPSALRPTRVDGVGEALEGNVVGEPRAVNCTATYFTVLLR